MLLELSAILWGYSKLVSPLGNTRIADKGFFFSASLQESSQIIISSRCVAQRYLSPQQSYTIMNLNQQDSQLGLSLIHQVFVIHLLHQVHLDALASSKPV